MAAKQLKEQGNRLYSQGKVEAALEVYSQAIVSILSIFNLAIGILSALPWLARLANIVYRFNRNIVPRV